MPLRHVIAQSENILLRNFERKDASFLLDLYSSPEWNAKIRNNAIHSLKSAEQFLKNHILKEYVDQGYGFYVIESLQARTPIGLCGITLRNGQSIPDIGFGVLPQYKNKGFAFEAATLVLQFIKQNFDFTKIDAFATLENIPSQNLLKKLGFIFLEEIFHPEFYAWVKHYQKTL